MEYASISNADISSHVSCKIISDNIVGSGVIIQNNDEDYVFIFTAKHCVFEYTKTNGFIYKDKQEVLDKLNITFKASDGKYITYPASPSDSLLYNKEHEDDSLVIVMKKASNRNELSKLPSLRIADVETTSLQCFFLGYPYLYNATKTEAIKISEVNFTTPLNASTTTPLEHLEDDKSAAENLKGFSGSGLFCKQFNMDTLIGVVYEIQQPFNKFPINRINKYINLIKQADLECCFTIYNMLIESEKYISLEKLNVLFERAKDTWLDQRYIPDIHSTGEIQIIGDVILRENREIQRRHEELIEQLETLEFVRSTLEFFNSFNKAEKLKVEIEKFINYNTRFIEFINSVIKELEAPLLQIPYGFNVNEFDVESFLCYIDDEKKTLNNSTYCYKIEDLATSVDYHDLHNYVSSLKELICLNSLLFLGEMGSGKTHGLSYLAENYLLSGKPALMVQSMKYSDSRSWKEILTDILGLGLDWSEEDIWNAMNECVRLSICENQMNISYFAVCIDGIDECKPIDNWIDRLNEVNEVAKRYKYIKFFVTSRPYDFVEKIKLIKTNIGSNDTELEFLFSSYFKKYKVAFENAGIESMIKWSIKTPFELRLFCENNRNRTVDSSKGLSVTITGLLNEKIQKIDSELRERFADKFSSTMRPAKDVLISMVSMTTNRNESSLTRTGFSDFLKQSGSHNYLDDFGIDETIAHLIKNGLIHMKKISTQDLFLHDDYEYYLELQPLTDYLLALKAIQVNKGTENIDFPTFIMQNPEAKKMYSLLMLQDHNILIGYNPEDEDNGMYFEYQAFALSRVTPQIAEYYVDWLKENFLSNSYLCKRLVNELVVNVCKNPYHPLGANLVHGLLSVFVSVADRDLLWSLPDEINTPCNKFYINQRYVLKFIESVNSYDMKYDKYNALPTILAWKLTSVDNEIRDFCRQRLIKWGQADAPEFIKLLNSVFCTNDPQMKDDLMNCLYHVAQKETNIDNLKKMALWCYENIFQDIKILRNQSAVIRFVSRAVIEIAYNNNLIDEQIFKKSLPPYIYDYNTYPICRDVLSSASEDNDYLRNGYGAIHGDLAWYVIKKAYDGFFKLHDRNDIVMPSEFHIGKNILCGFGDYINIPLELQEYVDEYLELLKQEYNEYIDKLYQEKVYRLSSHKMYSKKDSTFFKRYIRYYDEIITPYLFALAYANSFIYNLGWSKKTFVGIVTGNKKTENVGIDIAISREYGSATHGSKSKVMTFAEKYLWCAINQIKSFFADRLHFNDESSSDEKLAMLDDYGKLVDIYPLTSEYILDDMDNLVSSEDWFIPNDLSPDLAGCESLTKDSVQKWIANAPFPTFEPWLECNNLKMVLSEAKIGSAICLFNNTTILNKNTMSDTRMTICSYLIDESDYSCLIQDMHKSSELVKYIKRTFSEYSYPNCNGVLPSGLIGMNWVTDIESMELINTKLNNSFKEYPIYKTISKLYVSSDSKEYDYHLPSKVVRDMLKIHSSNDFDYYDLGKTAVCVFKPYSYSILGDSQSLLYADKNTFGHELEKRQLKIFWFIDVKRSHLAHITNIGDKFYPTNDRTWIAVLDEKSGFQIAEV